jgi:glucosamine-6-phosphate deaminase
VVDDAAGLSRAGADLVTRLVHADGPVTVVPATGETPVGMYAELAARRERGDLDTSGVSVVQLDEYLGLASDDRRALFGWMDRTVLEPLAIDRRVESSRPTATSRRHARRSIGRSRRAAGSTSRSSGSG